MSTTRSSGTISTRTSSVNQGSDRRSGGGPGTGIETDASFSSARQPPRGRHDASTLTAAPRKQQMSHSRSHSPSLLRPRADDLNNNPPMNLYRPAPRLISSIHDVDADPPATIAMDAALAQARANDPRRRHRGSGSGNLTTNDPGRRRSRSSDEIALAPTTSTLKPTTPSTTTTTTASSAGLFVQAAAGSGKSMMTMATQRYVPFPTFTALSFRQRSGRGNNIIHEETADRETLPSSKKSAGSGSQPSITASSRSKSMDDADDHRTIPTIPRPVARHPHHHRRRSTGSSVTTTTTTTRLVSTAAPLLQNTATGPQAQPNSFYHAAVSTTSTPTRQPYHPNQPHQQQHPPYPPPVASSPALPVSSAHSTSTASTTTSQPPTPSFHPSRSPQALSSLSGSQHNQSYAHYHPSPHQQHLPPQQYYAYATPSHPGSSPLSSSSPLPLMPMGGDARTHGTNATVSTTTSLYPVPVSTRSASLLVPPVDQQQQQQQQQQPVSTPSRSPLQPMPPQSREEPASGLSVSLSGRDAGGVVVVNPFDAFLRSSSSPDHAVQSSPAAVAEPHTPSSLVLTLFV